MRKKLRISVPDVAVKGCTEDASQWVFFFFIFIIAFLSLYINCPITCFYEGLLYPQSSQRVWLTVNYGCGVYIYTAV